MILEIVVETVEDALAAEAGGADQIEVKCDYLEYGLTPTGGMLAEICRSVSCPVLCMIRPHARSFVYSSSDIQAMTADIQNAKELPVNGFLTGGLTSQKMINLTVLEILKKAAEPLDLNLHLAWEMAEDPILSLTQIISLGMKSVRISGGGEVSGQASENVQRIRQYYSRFGKQLDFYLAGGVTAENVLDLVVGTGITNVHAGSGVRVPQTRTGAVSENRIAALKQALVQAAEIVQKQGTSS